MLIVYQSALSSLESRKSHYLYEVLKPLDVKSGPASPWFGEAGGATQYTLPGKIEELIEQGALRQVKAVPGTKK
ncbi:TNT domain-containing protein [Deinococcus caeni]|uniref:TNT domain-containing protein n=1 Tax=Deinococcus caeni TaxID=569127 RepID=UPI00361072B8